MFKYNRHRFSALFSDLSPGTNHHPTDADTSVPEDQLPFNQDQTPEPEEVAPQAEPPPAQDQADDQPFEEAVPLEDELSALLDSID